MSERVPTVEVVGEHGDKLIINEADYTPERHTLWAEREKTEKPDQGEAATAEPKRRRKGAE